MTCFNMKCYVLISMLMSRTLGQLLISKNDIIVPIGREVYIKPSDLKFHSTVWDELCRVEVVTNEPISQRVGSLEPQVFDCAFNYGTVKYSHHGSPLLDTDIVKLRSYKFTKRDTVAEYFDLNIIITNESYNVIQLLQPLVIQEFNGLTDTINESLINFNFSRNEGAICKARLSRYFSNRPAHGQIVIGQEKRPVDVIKRKCDDFLSLGLQYKHLRSPTPNIDYISIVVEVSDPLLNKGELVSEWFYIPVEILPGFPNTPPKPSFSSMYLMDIDQFIVTTISPAVLSSTDTETPSEHLIFNISRPLLPHQGCIVHLSDHTRLVTSFRQIDLNNFDIAYKPPKRSFKDRQTFEIGFTVFDNDFVPSEPFTLYVAIRPAVTKAPRISMNTGMVLLEGQSRPLRPQNLEIVDSNNLDDIQIFITGGLHHGKLEVGRRPAISFTPNDIEAGRVIYYHDDSDSTKDSLNLRIYDGNQSTHIKFPISIIPKDDNPPNLVINFGLKVEEGKSVLITQSVLRAVDYDTSDELITFLIKKPPTSGTIWKKFAWEKEGSIAHQFTQRDISKNLVYYHHNGNDVFVDYFDVIIQDANNPPNLSPLHKVMIEIIPIGDDPPKRDLSSSFNLQVPETDLTVLTSKELRYIDSDSDDNEIVYIIIHPPEFIGTVSLNDPGRIVSVVDEVFLTKDSKLLEITNFTQEEINHHKVAYMPPMEDIGPHPLYLQYVFSVSNKPRNIITDQVFNITLLPVNNQMPQLHTGHLYVEEGASTLLSSNELSVYDPDTLRTDLQMSLFTIPLHGSLRRSSQPLRVGDLLSLDDILTLRLEYKHDGSESVQDRFKVGVNDGFHFVAGEVLIEIEPIDDELPVWRQGLLDRISVNESGAFKLTSEVLSASDVDTDDSLLFFILTRVPQFGSILVDNRKVSKFRQKDVDLSIVTYLHDGREIGPVEREDVMTFIVTDKAFPRLSSQPSHTVTVKIIPQNNQPPSISFKKAIAATEGQRNAITEDNFSAEDRDTFPSDVILFVKKQPVYGHLENMRTKSGYEAQSNHQKIKSFSLQDLKNGFILFVQSNHRGIEPEADSLEIFVSDGIHNSSSVLVLVTIALKNDEEPLFDLKNISLSEGDSYLLDNIITASDADYPSDTLIIHLKSQPVYGIITHRVAVSKGGPIIELPFKELPLEDFKDVSYHHDGSESLLDSFEMALSDGIHRIYKTSYVSVMPVNDESPTLVRNIVAKAVEIQGSVVLSSAYLLVKDLDTPHEELFYIVLIPPKCGVIERKLNASLSSQGDGSWSTSSVQNFTQEEVDNNLIRYQHNSTFSTCFKDEFSFLVTDGIHKTPTAHFLIQLVDIGKTNLTIIATNITVDKGSEVIFNSSLLYAYDGSSKVEDITFIVVDPPQWGVILHSKNITLQITSFGILDIIREEVLYKHSNLSRSNIDRFTVSISNGVIEKNITMWININFSGDAFFNVPILENVQPLHVDELNISSSIITSHHLLAKDPEIPPNEIIYSIVKLPMHGKLVYSNQAAARGTFSQEDINEMLISYQSNRTASSMYEDEFSFTVSNGKSSGFVWNNEWNTGEIVFHITVKPKPEDGPAVHVIPLHSIQVVWNGHLGFFVTSQHLKVVYPPVAISDLRFYVTNYLQHGYVFHTKKEKVVRFFTQHDIDSNVVVIILKMTSEVRDFFSFQVAAGQATFRKEYRMDLFWASLYFPLPEYSVCEDAGTLNISIHRKGNLNISSHVSVTAIGQSAKEILDYIPGRARTVQFDPGVSSATWPIVIVRDDLHEAPIEQVQVLLYEPQNALIGFHNRTLISIYDIHQGYCSLSSSHLVTTDKNDVPSKGNDGDEDGDELEEEKENTSASVSMVCNQNIYGLLQYSPATDSLFECNGKEWVPWNSTIKKDGRRPVIAGSKSDEDEVHKGSESRGTAEPRQTTPLSCSQGWHLFDDVCHKFQRQQSTWSAAQGICNGYRNSRLVEIQSKQHNEWLVHLARNKPFWIGLHASLLTNDWIYGNSKTMQFSNWKKGFPRLPASGEMKHKCVLVRGSGFWINRHCEYHEHSFICSLPIKH